MGIPGEFDRPEFIEIMQNILKAGFQASCPAGIHIIEPDGNTLRKVINEGYRLIAYSVDIRMLDISARLGVEVASEMEK